MSTLQYSSGRLNTSQLSMPQSDAQKLKWMLLAVYLEFRRHIEQEYSGYAPVVILLPTYTPTQIMTINIYFLQRIFA